MNTFYTWPLYVTLTLGIATNIDSEFMKMKSKIHEVEMTLPVFCSTKLQFVILTQFISPFLILKALIILNKTLHQHVIVFH
jgi:hypothetical protein